MVAQGIYAFRPPLPTVIGNEGVGRILAVGAGVGSVKVGDRVLAPLSSFTWRERMVISAGGLSSLASAGVQAVVVEQSNMLLFARQPIAEAAASKRLPTVYGYREHVDAGGVSLFAKSCAAPQSSGRPVRHVLETTAYHSLKR
jgi:NADPH:quinone reductase-like Zn-dependent oxidoreductase